MIPVCLMSYLKTNMPFFSITKSFRALAHQKKGCVMMFEHRHAKSVLLRCLASDSSKGPSIGTSDQQHVSGFRASEVEFSHTRAREVSNAVAESLTSGHESEMEKHDSEYGVRSPDNHENWDEVVKYAENLGDKEHLEAYEHSGSVSLNSVMQSTVPQPFSSSSKSPVHVNMPGGTWSREQKYLSGERQSVHQSQQNYGQNRNESTE
ncbi:uncharacterized protein LOC143230871 [Tachypleus tridentatus]|uniref:uncharacterized protein LOC143230871 n=1 Tax=Tachypleus tridentatus TaxID=6853 RepID=UPI003FD60464